MERMRKMIRDAAYIPVVLVATGLVLWAVVIQFENAILRVDYPIPTESMRVDLNTLIKDTNR